MRAAVRASVLSLLAAALGSDQTALGDDKAKGPSAGFGKAPISAAKPTPPKGLRTVAGPPGQARVRPGEKWPKFKANLEALNAKLKSGLPALRAMSAVAPTPTPASNLTAGGSKAGKSLGTLGGSPNPAAGLASAGAKNLDTIACTQNPTPSLQRFEGELTPSGFLLLRGSCLGTSKGQVLISGRFQGGALRIVPDEWGNTYAAAVVPDVIGIPDHGVTIKVFVGGKFSNELQANFIARRERAEVSIKYTRNVLCTHQDTCVSDPQRGVWAHHTATNPVEDIDTWETKLPAGWEFSDIRWEPNLPPSQTAWVRYAGGAENGPPDYAKWNMRWRSECEDAGTTGSDYCFAGYRLHVFAWGPVGTMTSP